MKGKIIKYVEEKGFGFILDEKARKRFFHISDTLNPLEIKEQLFVEFEPHEGEKGLSCKKIRMVDNHTNTRFIKLYDTNIKCSNIKQFGIAQDNEYFYREKRGGMILHNSPGDIPGIGEIEIVPVPYDYLYVTTYQGDNYSWKDSLDSLKKNLKFLEDSLY